MSNSKRFQSCDMASVQRAFKDWISTREKVCRIPEHLWEMAVNLSHHYPRSTICQKLGLNYGDLKKKINQLSINATAQQQKSPSFIELKLKGPTPILPINSSTPCAIELSRADGTIMKIFASNETPLNLLELCETFLGKN